MQFEEPKTANGKQKKSRAPYEFVTYSWVPVDSLLQFMRHPQRLLWDISYLTNDDISGHSILLGTDANGKNVNALRSWLDSENDNDCSNILLEHAPVVYGNVLDHTVLALVDGGPALNKTLEAMKSTALLGMGKAVKRNCTHHGINKPILNCKAHVTGAAGDMLTGLNSAYKHIWYNAHTLSQVQSALAGVKAYVQDLETTRTITTSDMETVLKDVINPIELKAADIFPGACSGTIMAGTLPRGMATSAVEAENSADKGGNRANASKSSTATGNDVPVHLATQRSRCNSLSIYRYIVETRDLQVSNLLANLKSNAHNPNLLANLKSNAHNPRMPVTLPQLRSG